MISYRNNYHDSKKRECALIMAESDSDFIYELQDLLEDFIREFRDMVD